MDIDGNKWEILNSQLCFRIRVFSPGETRACSAVSGWIAIVLPFASRESALRAKRELLSHNEPKSQGRPNNVRLTPPLSFTFRYSGRCIRPETSSDQRVNPEEDKDMPAASLRTQKVKPPNANTLYLAPSASRNITDRCRSTLTLCSAKKPIVKNSGLSITRIMDPLEWN